MASVSQPALSPAALPELSQNETEKDADIHGNVYSHDPRLNTDVFDFNIDLKQYLLREPAGPPIWIVGEQEPAVRRTTVRQVDNTPYAPEEETSSKDSADERRKTRHAHGLPYWARLPGAPDGTEANLEGDHPRRLHQGTVNTKLEGVDDSDLRAPKTTLRDWANEKEVYEWHFDALQKSLEALLTTNHPFSRGEVTVTFTFENNEVSVKRDNWLSRTVNNFFWYILLWTFLIYPLIIWPWKQLSSSGGGEWRVAGSSFTFTKRIHMPDSRPSQTIKEYEAQRQMGNPRALPNDAIWQETPRGIVRIEGLREGQWFAQWEDTIAALVRQGYKREISFVRSKVRKTRERLATNRSIDPYFGYKIALGEVSARPEGNGDLNLGPTQRFLFGSEHGAATSE
ncbi:hypothetical protein FRB90_010989 [Tulasnella sp. 427]|nr:hypothetical protein FRB90_010989 [Tulasnella sp. 427]